MSILTNKIRAQREQGLVVDAEISAKANLLQQKLSSKLIKLSIQGLTDGSSKRSLLEQKQDE